MNGKNDFEKTTLPAGGHLQVYRFSLGLAYCNQVMWNDKNSVCDALIIANLYFFLGMCGTTLVCIKSWDIYALNLISVIFRFSQYTFLAKYWE